MTDLEISKALAVAIGWPDVDHNLCNICIVRDGVGWSEFDYRDWNVIGPIAAKFDCFPYQNFEEKWTTQWGNTIADTPQKAMALAVIKGAKE